MTPRHDKPSILVVDDEEGMRDALQEVLEDDYFVRCVPSGAQAVMAVEAETFDVVLLDLSMPEMSGLETLRRIRAQDKGIEILIVSAVDRAREAVDAIRLGAYDYVTKPFDPDHLLDLMQRVVQKRKLEREAALLRSGENKHPGSTSIVTKARCMESVLQTIELVAKAGSSSVLVTGESGTGKELVARAIHEKSPRRDRPFVAINCAAIPAELIASVLFGHEKGAFTGAHQRCIGKFEYADGGTIFLDEVATLKPDLQAQLLRILQEREITRVGSNRTIKVDVRVIAATNSDLDEMVRNKNFREDLFFRLRVVPVELPPLRHRKGDVPLLVRFFLQRSNEESGMEVREFTPEAMGILEAYPWPGNVRELQNLVERVVVMSGGAEIIGELDLPYELLFHNGTPETGGGQEPPLGKGLDEARQEFERQYILRILKTCKGNQSEAARHLGIHRNTLRQKMRQLGITLDEDVHQA